MVRGHRSYTPGIWQHLSNLSPRFGDRTREQKINTRSSQISSDIVNAIAIKEIQQGCCFNKCCESHGCYRTRMSQDMKVPTVL